MPAERVSMRHIREVLRLRFASELPQRGIAKSLGCAEKFSGCVAFCRVIVQNSRWGCRKPLPKQVLAWICRFSPSRGRFRPWLRRGPHQLGQPDEVVGSGSQGENPTDAGDATLMGLAKAGGRLGPAKHLLNALAHPATDRIARMAGRPTVDRRAPMVVF